MKMISTKLSKNEILDLFDSKNILHTYVCILNLESGESLVVCKDFIVENTVKCLHRFWTREVSDDEVLAIQSGLLDFTGNLHLCPERPNKKSSGKLYKWVTTRGSDILYFSTFIEIFILSNLL